MQFYARFYVVPFVFIIYCLNFSLSAYDYNSTECQLARKLDETGFGISEIGTLFCIVKRRSNFLMKEQTTDTDESYWGLFAVSDRWWCDKDKDGGICNVKCSDLLTDIEKNAKCGRRVYRQSGSSAWKLSDDCWDSEDQSISDCMEIFQQNFGSVGERIDLP